MTTHATRAGLLACASTLAFLSLGATPALSQEEAAEPAERIIVTAQRREQELGDVSVAVSVVNSDRLESAQIHTIEDLQQIVPSIHLGNDFNMAKLFIRGVGANTSTTGSETGVAMHVDGVFVARAEAQLTSLFDLERVEVLRGPQGTLYGRNAVGGSINLITAKPTDQSEGYLRGTIGNYEAFALEGAAGGPINDNVLARMAFRVEDRGGFGENPVTGNDIDDLSRQMFRGHLLLRPAEALEVLLTGEVYQQDDASRALKFRRESYPGVTRLFSPGVGGYAADPRDLASEVDPETETETWALTGRADWEVNDNFTLTNITSYRELEGFITQDLDVSAVVSSLATNNFATTIQRRDVKSEQLSTEFQGTFTSDWMNGVLGLFYFNEEQNPVDTVGLLPFTGQAHLIPKLAAGPISVDGAPPAPGSFPLSDALALCNTAEYVILTPTTAPKRVCIFSDLESEAWAAFGQVVIELGSFSSALAPFAIKLGGRYTEEEVSAANPNIIFAGNGLGPILIGTAAHNFNSRKFDDFTPEAGVEFRPTDDLLLYYTYSEGFKAGAGENAAPAGTALSTIVDPEEIKNHEIGVRATLLDGRLDIAAAGFTYELTGQQINKTITGGPAGFSTIFQNAASTSADGIEIEFAATPADVFRLTGAVSWLDSKYDDFITIDPLVAQNVAAGVANAANCPAADDPSTWPVICATSPVFGPLFEVDPLAGDIQLAGNRTRNSPEWAANVHAELDLISGDMLGGGALTAMTDVTYRDDVFFTEFERLLEGQEAYTIWDFNLRFEDASSQIVADLWIKNITDEEVASSTFALATARTIGVTYLPPQTYGLSLGYRF
jgi:iron complex outermembrane receptor protein